MSAYCGAAHYEQLYGEFVLELVRFVSCVERFVYERAEVMRFVQSVVDIVMYCVFIVVIVRAYFGIDIRNFSVRIELAEEYRFCEKAEAFGRLRNSAAVKHQLDVELLVLIVVEVFHVFSPWYLFRPIVGQFMIYQIVRQK